MQLGVQIQQLPALSNFMFWNFRKISKQSVSLLPNPVQSELLIVVDNAQLHYAVDIIDLTGKKVMSLQLQSSGNQIKH